MKPNEKNYKMQTEIWVFSCMNTIYTNKNKQTKQATKQNPIINLRAIADDLSDSGSYPSQ